MGNWQPAIVMTLAAQRGEWPMAEPGVNEELVYILNRWDRHPAVAPRPFSGEDSDTQPFSQRYQLTGLTGI